MVAFRAYMHYARTLINQILPGASCLILGPRQTGKSTILGGVETLQRIDLLSKRVFQKYNKDPEVLLAELASHGERNGLVSIDEIQRIPALLDVIHQAIEQFPNLHFILSGSSARKLKTGAVNLLGGRALDLRIHPLSFEELGDTLQFDLVMRYGSLPRIYNYLLAGNKRLAEKALNAYVSTYLEEEIRKEALTRDLAGFQRFLQLAASGFSQQVNLSAHAVATSLSDQTIREYFTILEETLIGFFLNPYFLSARERLAKTPKFYFFDNGVTRAINGFVAVEPSNIERGALFEQLIVQEVRKLNDYHDLNYRLFFWRTASGAEVDLLLVRGTEVAYAIECKSSEHVTRRDLSGLVSICSDYPKAVRILCAPVQADRKEPDGILIMRPESLLRRIVVAQGPSAP